MISRKFDTVEHFHFDQQNRRNMYASEEVDIDFEIAQENEWKLEQKKIEQLENFDDDIDIVLHQSVDQHCTIKSHHHTALL